MSRTCKARVAGDVEVELVCDECQIRKWVPIHLDGEDPECLEWEAISQSTNEWSRADDCIVCSDECAESFWDQN